MSKRSDIASATATLLTTIPNFVSIKRVSNIDNKFPYDLLSTELPAIKIHLTDESIDYRPELRALNTMGMDLYVYSIEWDKDSMAAEEVLLKAVREVFADIRILETATNCDIRSIVKMETMYPLVMFKLNINVLYEGPIGTL